MKLKQGFIGLVGPTNSGKSTLLNAIIGEKVSIVSRRAQTTYHGVRGILNEEGAQLVFVDTPGFQRHGDTVARLLNKVADRNARDCDILAWIFDASNPSLLKQCMGLKEKIEKTKTPRERICVLNKIDKIAKPSLLPLIQSISEMGIFSQVIPLSAKTSDGVRRFVQTLKDYIQEGEPLFATDIVTDRSEQFLVAEKVREAIYEATRQEIPYSAWVEIEEWESPEGKKRFPMIRAVIHVDAPSRKAIVIGKRGEMLKRIASAARRESESFLGTQIVLKIYVDVEKEWKSDTGHLSRYLELGG